MPSRDRSEPNVKFEVDANEWNWNGKPKWRKMKTMGRSKTSNKNFQNSTPILPSERVSQGKVKVDENERKGG